VKPKLLLVISTHQMNAESMLRYNSKSIRLGVTKALLNISTHQGYSESPTSRILGTKSHQHIKDTGISLKNF
jgi:hypothetical protein